MAASELTIALVGDTQHDVEMAVSLGLAAIGVQRDVRFLPDDLDCDAIVIGVLPASLAIKSMRESSNIAALARGSLVAAGLSAVAIAVLLTFIARDLLAIAHLLYVILTVGAPLAGSLLLVRAPRGGRGFRMIVFGLLLLAPIGFYATHIEPFWLRVDIVAVPVPVGGGGDIRIGVLSDLQTDSIGKYEESAVATLLNQKPDVVLIPGDLWQLPHEEFAERAPEFAALIARIGEQVRLVFIVNGNTDTLEGLRQISVGTGAVVLDNEVADVIVDGRAVRILGVSYAGDCARLNAARLIFAEPTPGEEPLRVVLAHQPDEVYKFEPDDPIDLFVAGHTHGGQIAIPMFGPLVTLSSVPRAVAAGGLNEVEGHAMYVSTGVGRERRHAPQVRFGVRPSVGVLNLVPTS